MINIEYLKHLRWFIESIIFSISILGILLLASYSLLPSKKYYMNYVDDVYLVGLKDIKYYNNFESFETKKGKEYKNTCGIYEGQEQTIYINGGFGLAWLLCGNLTNTFIHELGHHYNYIHNQLNLRHNDTFWNSEVMLKYH